MGRVQAIIDEVRRRAMPPYDYANRFDGCMVQSSELRIGEDELDRLPRTQTQVVEALREAIGHASAFMNASYNSPGRLKPKTASAWASASRPSSARDYMCPVGPRAIHHRW